MALALIGPFIVALVRSQKDLQELEHGHVPDEVDRAFRGRASSLIIAM